MVAKLFQQHPPRLETGVNHTDMTEQLAETITPSGYLQILPAIIESLALTLRQLADHLSLDNVRGQQIQAPIIQY
ncbi:hypothetical protein D3C84_1228910 [compost metagenome]